MKNIELAHQLDVELKPELKLSLYHIENILAGEEPEHARGVVCRINPWISRV